MKLDAILIDDELDALSVLDLELQRHCPQINVIDKCNSAKTGLLSIRKHNPDIIFLDINMPYINGLELIEMLPQGKHKIVFTTAFDGFAVKAIKTSAVDYLLKPIKKDELINTVERLIETKSQDRLDYQFLANQLADTKSNAINKVVLPSLDGYVFIKIDEIIVCESDESYSHIHLDNGDKIFIKKPLKFLEEILCDGPFMRIHKSYIIQLNKITRYSKVDGGFVIMENQMKINISRIKKDEFAAFIEKH